jgi:uncharacterized protein
MKIQGSHAVSAPRHHVWEALQDPAVLVRTLPGCVQLEAIGQDQYRATIEAGVASIRGLYTGTVALGDQSPTESYTLKASGQGAPGTVDAIARVRLADAEDGGTRVEYDCDAVVGGSIGGVGQRVLSGVAKKTAAEFFKAVEDELLGVVPATEAPPTAAEARTVAAGEPAPRAVYRAPVAPRPAPADAKTILAAAIVGALIALLGVLVGRRSPARD